MENLLACLKFCTQFEDHDQIDVTDLPFVVSKASDIIHAFGKKTKLYKSVGSDWAFVPSLNANVLGSFLSVSRPWPLLTNLTFNSQMNRWRN